MKNGVGVIKMFSDNDATHRETLTWMAEEVKRLQAQVAALGLVHGDMHFGNIALAVQRTSCVDRLRKVIGLI